MCKGCSFCVQFCPYGLIHLNPNFNSRGYHPATFEEKETNKCTGCGICFLVCPDIAITVYKEPKKKK